MKIALTGASGLVGQFLSKSLTQAGHSVTPLSRPHFDLAQTPPPLDGFDALVHAGFAHVPGKYRGGEGDDPDGFRKLNVDGSLALLGRARSDGVGTIAFLSSRAIYGDYAPGTTLTEQLQPRPDTLYGKVKSEIETALPDFAPNTASLRATGVYGPGPNHKWQPLFRDFLNGTAIAPRVATEIHGDDLARALCLALTAPGHQIYNASDIILDRHDLLAEVARLTGTHHPLPERADTTKVSAMECTRLRSLGWRPGGMELLRSSLRRMLPSSL